MYTTTDERGVMNNYATEPEIYYAVAPSAEQNVTISYKERSL